MMKRTTLLAVALAILACPAALMAESFSNVPIADVACSTKVQSNPDTHTRACALQCAKTGYGIFTKDGRFLKLDEAGNQKVVEMLKASDKNDHLRVNVDGDVSGDTVKVKSIQLL